MKNKKKLITIISIVLAVLIIAAVAVYFIFFRGEKPPTLKETVENRISAYETDLRDSLSSMTDQDAVAKYLVTWAENKGIEVKRDKHNNVIYTIGSTSELADQEPVVIACSYDYAAMESYINSMVTAFTIARSDEPHVAYRVMFLSAENGDLSDIEAISSQYFTEGTKLFYLGGSSSSRISSLTGGYQQYSFTRAFTQTSPIYNKAYKVTLSGLPAQSIGTVSDSTPNAIKTLGNLLANYKSNSILFDLASFEGGSDSDITPQSASFTIVISEEASTRLEGRLDSTIERFYDRYQERYPDISYTYEVVETPSTVISAEDTESLISLLYTSLSGVHYEDENDDTASLTNIGTITTSVGAISLGVSAVSWDTVLLSEIREAYETTCALSGFSFGLVSEYPPVSSVDPEGALEAAFRDAYSDYQNVKLDSLNMAELTPCGILSAKNESMSTLILGVTERTKDNFAGGLITYLMPQV